MLVAYLESMFQCYRQQLWRELVKLATKLALAYTKLKDNYFSACL